MSGPTHDVIVIGAGAAGLAAARVLHDAGRDVCVLDAGDAPGGVMRSERIAGHLVERGPNTMQVKAAARALFERTGLREALVPASPASRRRFLWHDGRLEPVPMSPLSFVRSPLLSARGKLRLFAEPFVRRGDPVGESVATFLGRRFGDELVDRLVGPALTGIYAGDERELGAVAVLGRVAEAERTHGSVVRGMLALAFDRSAPKGLSGSWSMREGLGALAAALAAPLGEQMQTGVRVRALERGNDGWHLALAPAGGSGAGERSLCARRVILAVPAPEAARLLESLDADLAALARGIRYVPIASVAVSLDPANARGPIDGFGFLVPRAAGLRLLGCLFTSLFFPDRAPPGRVLATCMLGGSRWPEVIDAPDDVLWKTLAVELERTLGLRTEPERLAITRWTHAVAQPAADHVARVARLRARLASIAPGLSLAGAWLDGVSVPDTLACGAAAADHLLRG